MKTFDNSPICGGCGGTVPANYSIREKPDGPFEPMFLHLGRKHCILCLDDEHKAIMMSWTPEEQTIETLPNGDTRKAAQSVIDALYLRH